MHRTTRFIALPATVALAALALAAGTAAADAGQDDPCHKGNIVCAPVNADVPVDLSGLDADVDVLTHVLNGHRH